MRLEPAGATPRGHGHVARPGRRLWAVVGGHDLPFFRATAAALVAGLPHSDLVDLPWAGHLPSLERPGETAELVRHYLRAEVIP